MLDAVALIVEEHVFHFAELAVGGIAIERLHQQVLRDKRIARAQS